MGSSRFKGLFNHLSKLEQISVDEFRSLHVLLLFPKSRGKCENVIGSLCVNRKDWILFEQLLEAVMSDLQARMHFDPQSNDTFSAMIKQTQHGSVVEWLHKSSAAIDLAFDSCFFMNKER